MNSQAYRGPEVSAKLVICVDDKVLMLRRKNGQHIFPGGHIEWREPIMDCLKREAMEELSYKLIEESELFDIYEYISSDEPMHGLVLHYRLHLRKRPNL
ncbi:MAG TPA: NUDIX hydrolase, partial [Verrucomicrobiae bacterium]|nr:NUDIX hydrolase [Verrucomicrobiae bacterium]